MRIGGDHRARPQRIHRHALRTELGGQPERHEAHAHLRQRVAGVRRPPLRVERRRRRQRQDVRVRRLQQPRQAGLRAEEAAARVDLLHQVEALHRRVQRAAQPDRAGVVDQDVDAAERVDRRRHRGAHRVLVADVALQRQAAPAGGFDLRRRRCGWCPAASDWRTTDFDAIATLAPSRAARSAIARPMPREAPVMNRVLPESVLIAWILCRSVVVAATSGLRAPGLRCLPIAAAAASRSDRPACRWRTRRRAPRSGACSSRRSTGVNACGQYMRLCLSRWRRSSRASSRIQRERGWPRIASWKSIIAGVPSAQHQPVGFLGEVVVRDAAPVQGLQQAARAGGNRRRSPRGGRWYIAAPSR